MNYYFWVVMTYLGAIIIGNAWAMGVAMWLSFFIVVVKIGNDYKRLEK